MSTPAARQRAYRARRGAGRMVLRITVDDVAVPTALVEAGFLAFEKQDDRKAVARAIEQMIAAAVSKFSTE